MNKQHILKYLKYIKKIENSSSEDDLDIYNNIILTECLIKTHPIQKSMDIIKNKFHDLVVKMDKEGEIRIKGDMSKLEIYSPLFTNLGYFISSYINDDIDKNGNEIDVLVNMYDDDTTGVILEAKYDILINPIPDILYHASPLKFKDKISKAGFIPKAGNKNSIHPDRIYLTDDFNTAVGFGLDLRKIPAKEMLLNIGFCVYEINGSGVKNLYSDINLRNRGFYTDQNIASEYCKLIIEHKWGEQKIK